VAGRGDLRRACLDDVALGGVVGNGSAPLEFDEAKIRIELNATAQDAGIQMLLDAEDWKRVEIDLPHGGARIMHVRASSSVGRIGVTELFFESAEPTLADLPLIGI
jgi:hypothetical protein